MKKLFVLLCVFTLVVGLTMSARAALVRITFDEDGINAYIDGVTSTHLLDDGVTVVYDQGDGDLVTDQYASLGVNWIVDPNTTYNEVTMGEMFNNEFDIGSDNQVLWYNGTTVEGNIQLDFLADSLAFDYRKPSDTDPMQVKLFAGATEVYDSGVFNGEPFWQTFTYTASDPSGYFDRIQMYGPNNKKFVIDNLEVNALVTITFDEAGVTSGPTNDRYDGTQVDTQYSSLGVTWVDTLDDDPDVLTGQGVALPTEFNGDGWDTDNMLWNYGVGGGGVTPVNAPILLSVPANSFSFELRRPNAAGTVDVKLYSGNIPVHEGSVSWDPGQDWQTFFYRGDAFDKVVLESGDKFNSDNYSFSLVGNPPVLDPIGNKSVDEGELLEFTVTASDVDGGDLTLTADILGAYFTDNGDGTGTFSWTPGTADEGSYAVTFSVEDDAALTDSETITISVGDVPPAPDQNGGGGGGGGCFISLIVPQTPAEGLMGTLQLLCILTLSLLVSGYAAVRRAKS
jgi:hypothetical protein